MEYIHNIDTNVLLYIQENIRSDTLTVFFSNFTKLGNSGILWISLSLILLCFKKTRKMGLVMTVSLFLGFIVTNVILKNLVARTRPFYAIPDLNALVPYPRDYSFPSGHTTSAFSICTPLFIMLNKKYSFIFLIFATLMGFSRLYVGVHYLTDVLCGLIIGIMCSIASYFLIKWFYNKYSNTLQVN
ncbi:MAG: phosphatase PAP2 family protein [Oscillospiraceae bacterium]